jgi:hypothetical protein
MIQESILDRQLQGLLAQSELSDDLNLNANTIKPCVARIWKTYFEKGSHLSRGMACSIITSELLKLDYDQSRIRVELEKWNRNNNPPLRQSDLKSTLKTAIRQNYNYSCNHYFLQEFCIGLDLCMYAKGKQEKRQINFRVFFSYNWQLILKNVAKLIYWLALPEIEKKRGFKPGSTLYVSHRDIAHYAGVSLKYVKKGLEELTSHRLIEYKPGTSRRWERNATEVRRIFPIPRPSKEALFKLDK